jgi:hypothetical protein
MMTATQIANIIWAYACRLPPRIPERSPGSPLQRSVGRAGAQQEVFIDLGFILCYGLLLAGSCGRLARRFEKDGHARTATVAVLLSWAGLLAAAVNALQKVVLTLELHGHIAQPLPALATGCAAITFTLAVSAALFVTGGTIAVRRSRRTVAAEGRA